LTVEATILGRVLHIDAIQALVHAACGLVGGEDALAGRYYGVRNANQLFLLNG